MFCGVDASDIVDGKQKIVLALLWQIILHYSITKHQEHWEGHEKLTLDGQGVGEGQGEGEVRAEGAAERGSRGTPSDWLLAWINMKLEAQEVRATNFTRDWNDGTLLGALVNALASGPYSPTLPSPHLPSITFPTSPPCYFIISYLFFSLLFPFHLFIPFFTPFSFPYFLSITYLIFFSFPPLLISLSSIPLFSAWCFQLIFSLFSFPFCFSFLFSVLNILIHTRMYSYFISAPFGPLPSSSNLPFVPCISRSCKSSISTFLVVPACIWANLERDGRAAGAVLCCCRSVLRLASLGPCAGTRECCASHECSRTLARNSTGTAHLL